MVEKEDKYLDDTQTKRCEEIQLKIYSQVCCALSSYIISFSHWTPTAVLFSATCIHPFLSSQT